MIPNIILKFLIGEIIVHLFTIQKKLQISIVVHKEYGYKLFSSITIVGT